MTDHPSHMRSGPRWVAAGASRELRQRRGMRQRRVRAVVLRGLVAVVALGCLCASASVAQAAPGDPVTAYGTSGVFRSGFGFDNFQVARGFVQPGGRLVVAGTGYTTSPSLTSSLALVGLTDAGGLDSTFGSGGTTVISNSGEQTRTAVSLPTGQILLLSTMTGSPTPGKLIVRRFSSNGVLDTSLGSGGRVDTGVVFSPLHAVLEPSGSVVMSGTASATYDDPGLLRRISPAGVVDTSYGIGGVATIASTGGYVESHALAVDSTGRAIALDQDGVQPTPAVTAQRFTASGTLDSTFGSAGRVALPTNIAGQPVSTSGGNIVVTADDRVVAGVSARHQMTAPDFLLFASVRLGATGALDPAFGSGGIAPLYMLPGDSTPVSSPALFDEGLRLDASGRLLLSGGINGQAVVLYRLLASGGRDPSFGQCGRTNSATIGSPLSAVTGVLQASNGDSLLYGRVGSSLYVTRTAGGNGATQPAPTISGVGPGVGDVASSNVRIRATIDPHTDPASAYLEWGATDSYGQRNASFTVPASQSVSSAFPAEPSTTYHYRFVATNGCGTTMSSDQTVTTPPAPPTISSVTVQPSATSAQLSFSVNPNGQATTVTTTYHADGGPDLIVSQSVGSGTSSTPVVVSLPNLTPTTHYSFSVVAASSAGTNNVTGDFTTTATPPVPANVALPTITGIAQENQMLMALNGQWSGSPTSYALQWERCSSGGTGCSDISGATAATYVLTSQDVGRTLRVRETASNAQGAGTPAQSSPTAVVTSARPVNTTAPTVTGTAKVGSPLTGQRGTWSGSPTAYDDRWLRCDAGGGSCASIDGATSLSYVPVAADTGSTLRLREAASNSSGPSDPVQSMAIGPVAPADVIVTPPAPPPPPPVAPLPPPPPPVTEPAPTPTPPTPTFSARSTIARSSLAKGIAASVSNVPAGATVTLKVLSGSRTLATKTVRSSSAGTVRLVAKLTKAQRAKLRKGSRLKLRVKIAPSSGATTTLTKTLRVT